MPKQINKKKCRTCWCPRCGTGFMFLKAKGPGSLWDWYTDLRRPFHKSFDGQAWWQVGFITEIHLPGFALEDLGRPMLKFSIRKSRYAIHRKDLDDFGIQEQLWAMREVE
jgi:hypothetical protein